MYEHLSVYEIIQICIIIVYNIQMVHYIFIIFCTKLRLACSLLFCKITCTLNQSKIE